MTAYSPWICLSLLLATCLLVLAQENKVNPCTEMKTCSGCIAAGAHCGWCLLESYDEGNRDRCDLIESLVPNGCDQAFIIMPDHNMTIDRDEELRNTEGSQEAIQLSPQEMTVKLRPNKPFKFDLTFRQAENYPVDLYYVMDLSNSMDDDKEKLAELGDLLAERMGNITENFRLGFGSFVDKKVMPYVSTVPEKLKSPCDGCAAPYGFKNQLKLTTDTSLFRTKVIAAAISGNLDGPEGGFDAIMQAITCQNEIGWRRQSRKLLIFSSDAGFHYAGDGMNDIGWREASRKMLLFSTDAGFHYAGDGKLGGIVKPNDGACHLDSTGEYTESVNQDYPSVSQIANTVSDQKVNVIFAVTGNEIDLYKLLAKSIEGSEVGELAEDSSNVVDLVEDNYEKIRGTVELKTEGAEDIYVTFRSKCNGTVLRDTAVCGGLGIGQNVTYEVTVEVRECPKDPKMWKKSFDIYPVGLTEKLTINLDMMCECFCEKPELEEKNSPKCNNSGTYECGACTCYEGFYGKHCQCDGSDLHSTDYDRSCKMTNDSAVCEGNGYCVCGICDCHPISVQYPSKKYSGTFCECNDHTCPRVEGKLCGGPEQGKCKCGACICNPGYTEIDCSCPISETPCLAENGEICNGKGTCHCGKCTCDLEPSYRGPTCEDCESCTARCDQNKDCVLCMAFETGRHDKEYCDANCTHVTLHEHVEESDEKKLCQMRDPADNCIFYFTYEYNSDKVEAQKKKECPQPVNVLAIVLGVIAGIILIGLALLLIWKLFVTVHDRREFAKFEKEKEMAKWNTDENPIYKQATSTYKNPTYGNN